MQARQESNNLTRSLKIAGAQNIASSSYAELQFSNFDVNDDAVDRVRAKITSTNSNATGNGDMRFFTYDGTLSERMRIEGAGNVGIDCDPAVKFQVGINGDGSTAEAIAWNTFSDRRYKSDITTIPNSIDIVKKLQGRSFRWHTSGDLDIGFIAQEVEAVLPDLVHTNLDGYKSLDYSRITPVLVEAIKAQQKMIDSLILEISQMKTDVKAQQPVTDY